MDIWDQIFFRRRYWKDDKDEPKYCSNCSTKLRKWSRVRKANPINGKVLEATMYLRCWGPDCKGEIRIAWDVKLKGEKLQWVKN